jgi:glutaredoxin 3
VDVDARDVVEKATGMLAVPQTDVNGHWVVGFDPDQIMEHINN